jgi:citronellol/citronellal dehydrogenase
VSSRIFADGLLDGRTAIVTGGGTGLGRASAAELIACGASVVICGRRAEVLEEAASALGPSCVPVAADIREPADAARVAEVAMGRFGRLDLLVNNAGGQYFVPAESIALKGWNAVWRLNVGGTLTMTRAAVDGGMREGGGGTVVNVTLSPHHGLAGMTHSSAARAAVEAMTADLAAELASDGISVVAVAAGHFATDALKKYPEPVRQQAGSVVPLGRLGDEREHAWLVALLASPLGPAFSGSVVTLDGARDNWYGPWPPPALVDDSGQVPTEARVRR